MDRRKRKVELFEQMSREYEHGVGTIKGVARKFGVHRRMVREAIDNAVPAARKILSRERPKLAAVIPYIEAMLEADRKAPRSKSATAGCRARMASMAARGAARTASNRKG